MIRQNSGSPVQWDKCKRLNAPSCMSPLCNNTTDSGANMKRAHFKSDESGQDGVCSCAPSILIHYTSKLSKDIIHLYMDFFIY